MRFLIVAPELTLFFAIGSGVPTAIIALGLALLVNRKMPGRAGSRFAFFIPAITSWVVAAIVWKMIFLPDQGLYLVITEPFGIRGVRWLSNRNIAMWAIIIMAIWKQVGPNLLIFLSEMQTVPEELTLLEIAEVYAMHLVADEDMAELFVNDRYALAARLPLKMAGMTVSLIAKEGPVDFEGVAIHRLKGQDEIE